MKRLLSRDPLTGIETYYHDNQDGKIHLETVQDLEPYLRANKELQKETFDKRKEVWPVATVPNTILLKWAHEAGVDFGSKEHGEVIKKRLNDPDNRAFRTGVFKL